MNFSPSAVRRLQTREPPPARPETTSLPVLVVASALTGRLAIKVDVERPPDTRYPIDAPDDSSASHNPPVPVPALSSAGILARGSPPLPQDDQQVSTGATAAANIESSSARAPRTSSPPPQVLGRRRRSLGPQTPPDSAASAVRSDAASAAPSSPHKRRRRDGAAMPTDADASGHSNGHRSNGSTTVTNGAHKAATNGSSAGDRHSPPASDPQPSSYFGHDREELTRILIQALSDMGYQDAADSVSRDSGFDLESSTVAAFRSAVLDGSWVEAEKLLSGASMDGRGGGNGLVLAANSDRNVMKFWLRQQKFLELLEQRDTMRALTVLRTELTPLYLDTSRVHFLASLLMCRSADDVMIKASWDGAGGQSRRQLLSQLSRCVSPSVMLPEHRLAVLLEQVKQRQIDTCLYHTAATPPSLYSDHYCDKRNFPAEVAIELTDLVGEAWQVQFSHDGSKLAAGGARENVMIWETKTFTLINALSGHGIGVGNIAWSPDDSLIVTCSQDKIARLWDAQAGTLLKEIRTFSEPVSSCLWSADSSRFVLGTLDKAHSLCSFNIRDDECIEWDKKHRVQDLCGSRDGRWLVAVDDSTNMYVYDAATRELEYNLDLGSRPTSISMSQDSRHLLVNKKDGEAQLIDLKSRNSVQKFLGHVGGEFMIRSALGGANESFVASGSENGYLFIWHKNIGVAVERLAGHLPRCNSVCWNPVDPCMLASCGDDGLVKIWTNKARMLELRSLQPKPSTSNGWRASIPEA
ncbi:hypothetical protein XA68_15166 [Ophiocordyceps unilateralis]|uniref:CTLH domain-containing protein n=1 Tax=Ophiocordyceps unilateralis TaxID=268505 RepID=A0A2A9PKP2_OPHUN|nr:hypothetical protein XA68_15166 [Ophiocordyceps unilateralis]